MRIPLKYPPYFFLLAILIVTIFTGCSFTVEDILTKEELENLVSVTVNPEEIDEEIIKVRDEIYELSNEAKSIEELQSLLENYLLNNQTILIDNDIYTGELMSESFSRFRYNYSLIITEGSKTYEVSFLNVYGYYNIDYLDNNQGLVIRGIYKNSTVGFIFK